MLADESIRGRVVSWTREFADDDVVVLAPEPAPEWDDAGVPRLECPGGEAVPLNGQLRRIGAVDVVVNLLPADRLSEGCTGRLDLFLVVVRHLINGGVFIHNRTAAPGEVERVARGVAELPRRSPRTPAAVAVWAAFETEAARSVGAIAITRDLVAVTKRQTHYVMLWVTPRAATDRARGGMEIQGDRRRDRRESSPWRTTVHRPGERLGDGGTPNLIRHPSAQSPGAAEGHRRAKRADPDVLRHTRSCPIPSAGTSPSVRPTPYFATSRWRLRPHRRRPTLPGRTLEGDYCQLEAA